MTGWLDICNIINAIFFRQIKNYKCSEKESGSYTVNDPISDKEGAIPGKYLLQWWSCYWSYVCKKKHV